MSSKPSTTKNREDASRCEIFICSEEAAIAYGNSAFAFF